MPRIKAAICRTFGNPLSVETVDLRAPVSGEVEVTLTATAICHSDISFADGIWGGQLPAVYGHEAAGTVTAIGTDVTGFAVGDTVIATLIRACGSCSCCNRGRPAACTTSYGAQSPLRDAAGNRLLQPLAIGAFAERVVVDQSHIVGVSSKIAPASAALLACGVITGVGAVTNAAALQSGETAVVIGAGGVGLNAIQGARIAGASRIFAVDMTREKLDAAVEFGATDGILATGEAPWADVHNALGGGADAVFVTVGSVRACTDAVNYLAPGGRVVIVGMPPSGATAEYEPTNIAAYGQSIIGSKMGETVLSRDIPNLLRLYDKGQLMLDELVSRTWNLDDINDAIADSRAGAARRNVIVF